MSDTTPTPADTGTTHDLAAMLVGGLLEGGLDPEVTPETPESPAPVVENPAEPAPQAPESAPGNAVTPEDVPVWSGQDEAGRAFAETNRARKAAEEAAQKAAEEAAYWRGLAEGRTPEKPAEASKPAVDADPEPDPNAFPDDTAYYNAVRAWDRRQAAKEATAALAPKVEALETLAAQRAEEAADRAWEASMARAQISAGADWPAVVAFTKRQQQSSRGWSTDLNSAADPGAFALQAYNDARAALGLAAAGTGQAPATATPPAAAVAGGPVAKAPASVADLATLLADPATAEAALQLIAKQRAEAGYVPQVPHNGPRGAGSGPSTQGVPDNPAAVTIDTVKAAKPAQLNELGRQTFGNFVVGDLFV